MTKKLMILGAGIGGLSVITELHNCGASPDDVEITVVDTDFSHFLGFTLPWVMRGWRDIDSVPIHPSAASLDGLATVTGTVQNINPQARTVTLADGTDLAFDALIIATGARNNIDAIPGLSEAVDAGTAVHYYSAEAAERAHQALDAFTGGKLTFLVTTQPYRCPVAPYEGSLLAADLLRDNGNRHNTDIAV
jgi:sulfide:quinone oxidoreductase